MPAPSTLRSAFMAYWSTRASTPPARSSYGPGTDTLGAAQAELARAWPVGPSPRDEGRRDRLRVGLLCGHIASPRGPVTAINVSPEQLTVSRMLAEREGVTNLVDFLG